MKGWVKTGLIIAAILLIVNVIAGNSLGRNSLETILLLVIITIIGLGLSLLAKGVSKVISGK